MNHRGVGFVKQCDGIDGDTLQIGSDFARSILMRDADEGDEFVGRRVPVTKDYKIPNRSLVLAMGGRLGYRVMLVDSTDTWAPG